MKYEIIIKDKTKDKESMAIMLRKIADLLDKGCTCGYYPTWEIKVVE